LTCLSNLARMAKYPLETVGTNKSYREGTSSRLRVSESAVLLAWVTSASGAGYSEE
jgi:hypothetical protein